MSKLSALLESAKLNWKLNKAGFSGIACFWLKQIGDDSIFLYTLLQAVSHPGLTRKHSDVQER